jgi:hypothetical protein
MKDILQNLFDLSLKLSGRPMLYEILDHSQHLLQNYYMKYLEKTSANVLYEEMLRETQKNQKILENEREQKEKERLRQIEHEKKKRDEMIELISQGANKEEILRKQFLENQAFDEESEEDVDYQKLFRSSSNLGYFNVPEIEALCLNLIRNLAFIMGRLKGTNQNESFAEV